MTTKAEYQSYARECLQWAAKAKTEAERRIFLEMADAWVHVALVRNDVAVQFAADARKSFDPINRAVRQRGSDVAAATSP
jgi:hypothetical protein